MTADTVADHRLHPGTLVIRFVKQLPEYVVGLPAIIGFASDVGIWRILLLALLGATIAAVTALLMWLRFRYGFGEREIVIESGVLNRQRRVIPFDRIQDIDIEQRLLARMFGLAKVRIETGGAAKDEGSLDAVSLTEAMRIRELIRKLPAASSKATVDAAEPLLFAMGGRRLLLAGLFNFSLFYLAVIGGAFQYFDPLIDRILAEPERWMLPSREQAARNGVYVTVSLLLIILFLGVVTGLLRTIARDYRFRLSLTANGFRRQRGLFTLSEVLIPKRRVQVALVATGLLRKRLGWWSLDFQTLSADAHQSGQQDAAPFARLDEIAPILAEAEIEPLPLEDDYIRVSRRMVLRRSISDLLPLAIIFLLAGLFLPFALLLVLPVLLGVAALALLWRRHAYAFGERALFVREGLLGTRISIMPYERLQTASIRRGPLQRRLGLATIEIDTAGASVFRTLGIRDLETAAANAVAARLLRSFRAARRMKTRGISADPDELIGEGAGKAE